ncbi:MAG: O-antigen ligase family protein [Cyclobacteriaceae bacterium]|nr:O-antigen ligase family protein [Cyclobacteriaceae bacterium]
MKEKHIDHLNGIAFAILLAMPVIRNDIIALPTPALILPAFLLFLTSFIRIYKWGTHRINLKAVVYFYFIFLMFTYLFLSGLWHPFGINLTGDIVKIVFIIFVCTAVILSFNLKSADYFINWIIVFSVIATFILFNYYIQAGNLRGWGIGNYLTRAQLIGVGAMACYAKLLFHPRVNKKFYLAITLFLFLGLALSLARGAFLTGVLLAIGLTLFYFHLNKTKSYSMSEWLRNKSSRIISFIFIGLTILAATQVERTASRLRTLMRGNIGGRQSLWSKSIEGFYEAPLIGFGLGSSGMVSHNQANYYPHNLYLQILVDGGFIAFSILFAITMFPFLYAVLLFKKKILTIKSYVWLPLLMCYAFLLLEFAKSSNFYDARGFIALGIIVILALEGIRMKNKT